MASLQPVAMRQWRRVILLFCGVAAMAAVLVAARTELLPSRYNPLAPLDLAEAPGPATGLKLWLSSGNLRVCRAALQRAGLAHDAWPPTAGNRPGCAVKDAVAVSELSAASLGGLEAMRCDIAMRLYLLERHVIQPAARRHLGSPVKRIAHFGSYSCRTIAGSSRLSEHATANAFDLAGFHLEDGRLISLKRHWTAGGNAARFLRAVREGACDLFSIVLSPDYNAAHADHFHLDMGFYRGCN